MLSDKLIEQGYLTKEEYVTLLDTYDQTDIEKLRNRAVVLKERYYGKNVYTRGLIEFTNYCKNNCFYCGIGTDNARLVRYRLSKEEILECCRCGWKLGFRTFVLQGGEDPYYTDECLVDIVSTIKEEFPESAITLSVGEKSMESYAKFKQAGADRYLLRHETADEEHYKKLHPESMSLSHRKECLYTLKKLGYEVGAGFMVGSPYQTNECLAEDLVFLRELEPHMVGIGPFIPHHETRFRNEKAGELEKTLLLLSIIRIILPMANIPATTALGTINTRGRELGILSGANVVMPNLSPVMVRKQYELYDAKICTGEEAAECVECLKKRIATTGHELVNGRGDSVAKKKKGLKK